jgi:hypothetical protein
MALALAATEIPICIIRFSPEHVEQHNHARPPPWMTSALFRDDCKGEGSHIARTSAAAAVARKNSMRALRAAWNARNRSPLSLDLIILPVFPLGPPHQIFKYLRFAVLQRNQQIKELKIALTDYKKSRSVSLTSSPFPSTLRFPTTSPPSHVPHRERA